MRLSPFVNSWRLSLIITLIACLGLAQTMLAADVAAEQKKLMGVWQGAAVDGDGSKPGSTRAKISELVITADKVTAKDGQGNSMGEGTYKLGKSGNFLTIDNVATKGQLVGKSYQGILLLEGDNLKWCSNNPGQPRPTAFKTTPPGAFLMVLTRKKQ
ncbi:MAG: TIGR03067 domain-containing protein [Verrucomicrobiota bacterium]